MSRKKLTVYQRIVRAGRNGTGTYLTPDDTWDLIQDDAIVTAACNDDEADEADKDQQP